MKYGRYELINFKHVDSRSRETFCFDADLLIDGVKFAHVSNEGRGGQTRIELAPPFTDVDFERETTEIVKDKHLVENDRYEPFHSGISSLVAIAILMKDNAKNLKKKAIFIVDGALYEQGYPSGRAPDKLLFDHILASHPTAAILNSMTPDDAAAAAFKLRIDEVNAERDDHPPGLTTP
jgi:hypothetical protein